jgi:hypothetical protein
MDDGSGRQPEHRAGFATRAESFPCTGIIACFPPDPDIAICCKQHTCNRGRNAGRERASPIAFRAASGLATDGPIGH